MRRTLLIFALCFAPGTVLGAPSFTEVKTAYQSSDAMLLDRHGEVLHELRVDPNSRKLEWVRLADISQALVKAMIRCEDKRFYDHHGVDWKALSSAAMGTVFGSNKRGASTISMQLASMLDIKLKSKKGQRSFGQKWDQIKAAQEIEKSWAKEQILEAYLNLVSFRGELQGISAASRGIFDKDPNGLDEAESAVLAALIRSPNASAEKVGERAELLAASLGSAVPSEKIRQLAVNALSKPYDVRKRIDLAPHVARLLMHREGSAVSTLDARLQRFAIEALRQAVGALSGQNVQDGAVLVVDNKSGDVLAYVGNAGQSSSAQFVDGTRARRQAGSSLKPFLYALAIEQKIITAASFIEDAPLDVPTERGLYRPENYDKTYRGLVTARTALASSLNVPAVRTVDLVGPGAFVEKLKSFGFTGLRQAEDYGPSLALGTADIALWELVNAYRTLANAGVWSELKLTPEQLTASRRRRALSREAAFIISDILSDREARSSTFTLESPLSTRFWTAVKTGTSKDMRDNWCVGYSEHYTVGVWVGNFSGAAMWNVSGVSGAAPIWLEIMTYLHGQTPSRTPSIPKGVTSRMVAFSEGNKQYEKREYFLAGTEQDSLQPRSAELRPKIIYPAPDTVIAVDPDIPEGLQKVFFEASSADPTLNIALDETIIGPAPAVSWTPVPGKHRLSLIAGDGAVADQVLFEVR